MISSALRTVCRFWHFLIAPVLAAIFPLAFAQVGDDDEWVFAGSLATRPTVIVGDALPDTVNALEVFAAVGIVSTMLLALALGVKVVKWIISLIV